MTYKKRLIEDRLTSTLGSGKSILVLGPRQVGKTTMLLTMPHDRHITLMLPGERQRYESHPDLLVSECQHLANSLGRRPTILLDEVQKVPQLLDVIQVIIDQGIAQFIITGSSARKLRRSSVNLLPGRLITSRLDSFVCSEHAIPDLDHLLLNGSLPDVSLQPNVDDFLRSYVETYLEEEVRAEALARKLGGFTRFLQLAASESGQLINLSKLSQVIGVSRPTIHSYYEILYDCLVAERFDPFIPTSSSRRQLAKSSKFILFDLGVRRLAAKEGRHLSRETMGKLFEQFVGLELRRLLRLMHTDGQITFWRDLNGPEVDWVVQYDTVTLPIEVKYTATPTRSDVKHLRLFMRDYAVPKGVIVCQTPYAYELEPGITALPWSDLATLL